MEQWQKDWIEDNATELYDLTDCKFMMLTALKSKKLLGKDDVEELIRVRDHVKDGVSVQKSDFYLMLMGKNCYDTLIMILDKYKLTGAADLLRKGIVTHQQTGSQVSEVMEVNVQCPPPQLPPQQVTYHRDDYCYKDSLINELDFCRHPNPLPVAVRQPVHGQPVPFSEYPLTPGGRRCALLLNIIRFHQNLRQQLCNRQGAEVDTKYMEKLWTEIGWEVKIVEGTGGGSVPQQTDIVLPVGTKGWITKADLTKAIEDFKESLKNEVVEGIVVYVSSHGFDDGVFTSDGEFVHYLEDILYQFNHERCPWLQGKPKIFVDNSCADYRNSPRAASLLSMRSRSLFGCATCGPEGSDSANLQMQTKTVKDEVRGVDINDAILIKAQIPGSSALRHPTKGSFFAVVFTHVFMNLAWNTDFLQMLNTVQDLVPSINAVYPDDCRGQLPVPQDFRLRKLYLFPTSS